MAKDATSTILVLGAVGVGGYFLWNMLSAPAAAAPVIPTTPTSPTAPISPVVPVNSGGVSPPSSGGAPAPVRTPPPPAHATPTGAGEPSTFTSSAGVQTTSQTLAGLWLQILAWAQTDPAFTVGADGQLSGSGYDWITYVNAIWPNAPSGYSGTWPPDLQSMFPGADLSAQMNQNTFFGGLMTFMHAADPGLNGLGCGCDGGNGAAVWWLMGAAAGAALLAIFANRGGLGA